MYMCIYVYMRVCTYARKHVSKYVFMGIGCT